MSPADIIHDEHSAPPHLQMLFTDEINNVPPVNYAPLVHVPPSFFGIFICRKHFLQPNGKAVAKTPDFIVVMLN